jgi:hypothetical protein
MEYRVITMERVCYSTDRGPICEEFSEVINQYLKSGWEPQGGIYVNQSGALIILYQSVIRKLTSSDTGHEPII